MATNSQVAEGPLIKHIPGGYAEFRQRESGLPPARLVTDEGEWWAKLVHKPTLDTPADPPIDPPVDVKPDDPINGKPSPDPEFDWDSLTDTRDINWDYYDNKKFEPYEWKTDYTPTEWNTDFKIPEGYGWGTSDTVLPYTGGLGGDSGFRFYEHPGMTDPPMVGPQLPPKGYQDPKFGEPIVIRPRGVEEDKGNIGRKPKLGGEKPFRFYDPKWNPNSFSNRVKGITTDVAGGVVSMSDAILGKTQFDQYPRPQKEKELGRLLKKWKDLVTGKGEEGLLLWETQGVPSSLGDRTPFGLDAFDTLKNLDKIIKNEHNIKTQEYGQLQVIAIMNMAKLIAMYGPIGAVPATVSTLAKDIMSGFKNAFADHPEFRGNPVQDLVHGTTWVLGQTLEKTYNATLAKIVGKIDGEKLKEQLSKLNIIEGMKAPAAITGAKITYTPTRPKHLSIGEPQMPVPDDPWYVRPNPRQHDRGQERGDPGKPYVPPPPVGQTTSPVVVQAPQGELQGEQQTETYGGTSPTQQRDPEQLDTKTITGGPMGQPVGRIETDQLTQEQLDAGPQISQKITPPEAAEIADQIIGEAPEGDTPFKIGTPKPPTGRTSTKEEVDQWLEESGHKGHVTEDDTTTSTKLTELDAETTERLFRQAERESQQEYFKEHGRFNDDAINEAFSKGPVNWLEQGTNEFRTEVDTDETGDHIRIGKLEDSISELESYYQQLENDIRWSNQYQNFDGTQTLEQQIAQNDAIRENDWNRDEALRGLYEQLSQIQDDNAAGAGVKETKGTPSAIQIWYANPDMEAEEAAAEAMRYAQDARTELTEQNSDEMWNKLQNFSHNLNETVRNQIFNIQAKQIEVEQASNQAGAANREQANEERQAERQAQKEAFDKQQAEMDATGEAIMKGVKDYYKKLEGKEPLMAAAGQAHLATKILYKGKDGGVVAVKDANGKTVGLAYVHPEEKKLIDEKFGGAISAEGFEPKSSGPVVVQDPSTIYVPQPDDPGE